MRQVRLVAVAVPVPFLGALTYRVPDSAPLPAVGARVIVEVGRRRLTGLVLEHLAESTGTPADDAPDGRTIKPLEAVVDAEAFVPESVVALTQWVAEYYLAGVGDALSAALPPGARNIETAARPRGGFRMRRVVSITAHGLSSLAGGVAAGQAASGGSAGPVELASGTVAVADEGRLTRTQRLALEALTGVPAGLPVSELRDRGVSAAVVGRLAARGFVTLREEPDARDPFQHAAPFPAVDRATRTLTDEQATVLASLSARCDRREFHVAMLRGVTGSGKTEIYTRLALRTSAQGRRALLMVPEIALTGAVASLFRQVFGARVAIQHSALSDGERHDQWHRIRDGAVDVVVGTRSAVFAPLRDVGLIIVDEEHDSSYKQEETPRYHGRDVAIVRGSRERALVVLGSATPSMETAQNAATGKYDQAILTRRVHDRPLADVRVVNMREEYAESGPDVVISRALAEALQARLAQREQAIVLLNRRGYATAVLCRQCGDTFTCPNCSISLTVHTSRRGRPLPEGAPIDGRVRCHYCNYSTRIPTACRKCAAPYLEHTGFGTEKVEAHLHELLPEARIGRVDRDSVRRKGALGGLLARFAAGELDVLVGTQMIAKGHDFPRVTLVGVISADVGLGMADFRAAERTFQLLTQVAGRAGRGEQPGEAIVQTLFPEHYSIRLACRQDYPAFFEKELQFRRSMLYPPLVAMINVVIRGRTLEEAMQTGAEIVARLTPAAATLNLRLLGPAPAPLVRLRGEHRAQLFLKGTRRAEMRNALRTVLESMPEVRRRVTVDIDPLNVL